jgi:hypothetical protein
MFLQKIRKRLLPSFRRKPESSIFKLSLILWTPVFTGVTTFKNDNFLDFPKNIVTIGTLFVLGRRVFMNKKRILSGVLLAGVLMLFSLQTAMAAERTVQLKIPGCG